MVAKIEVPHFLMVQLYDGILDLNRDEKLIKFVIHRHVQRVKCHDQKLHGLIDQ